MHLSIQKITRIAVLSALALSVSLLTKVQPSLSLFHLGPIVIVASALLLGPSEGALIGGLSMGLFDIFFYNPASAPKTIVSYSLFGLVVGYIAFKQAPFTKNIIFRYIVAIFCGGIIFTLSYFIFNAYIINLGLAYAKTKAIGCSFIVLATFAAIPIALILKPYTKQLKK
ncbi:MAG: ECF transporter S component [Culicoidibacterales bacterium]